MKLILPISFISLFFSCQTKTNEVREELLAPPIANESNWIDEVAPTIIDFPFDTTTVINNLNITEKFTNLETVHEPIEGLKSKIDTLELTYYFAFCDCQRWIISEIHDHAQNNDPSSDINELDPRGQIQFNIDAHGFYIEPATSELEIDERVCMNGTRIRFIGREYEEKGLTGAFTVPDPPLGRVFRYYSYEIIRPYNIWGPRCRFPNDSSEAREPEITILTVN